MIGGAGSQLYRWAALVSVDRLREKVSFQTAVKGVNSGGESDVKK